MKINYRQFAIYTIYLLIVFGSVNNFFIGFHYSLECNLVIFYRFSLPIRMHFSGLIIRDGNGAEDLRGPKSSSSSLEFSFPSNPHPYPIPKGEYTRIPILTLNRDWGILDGESMIFFSIIWKVLIPGLAM